MRNLVLTVRAQEMVAIGNEIKLKFYRDNARRLKVVIAAPDGVRIVRVPLPKEMGAKSE